MNLSKEFDEKRRIEALQVKLSPKEKFVLDQYIKEVGIKNASDWVRQIIFSHIDNGIKINNLLVS